jgi:isoaspartyl peptidase/L-asparaginase-like protein (Ntn-hydrolase superfamily)
MSIPIILSTWSFGTIANAAGWPVLLKSGALDAVEAACAAVDADLSVDSVGRGGSPDASGEVTLDGCIMLSPAKSAGVAYVKHYLHPVSIARQVMEKTPHKLLVGEGADAFAASCGFTREELLTDDARRRWEKWRDESDETKRAAMIQKLRSANREEMPHDTVGVLAIDASGTMAGACSTSGLPFKLPGRVGDSPIIGHGLYVEPGVGAAVATGNGELMMGICAAFLAVERMRGGDSPAAAIEVVIERARRSYELRGDEQCAMIALRADGEWTCGAIREGFRVAVRMSGRDEMVEAEEY